MAALDPQTMTVLKKVLDTRFVPHLPALLGPANAAISGAKNIDRSFSGFALHKRLDLAPLTAAATVVDDFNDNGIDAIHYAAKTETLYLVQAKLKATENFQQDEAQAFCAGIRLLLKQEFTAFNANVQKRQAEIEHALDVCSHIQLVVAYTGAAVSTMAADAMQALLDDEDLDDTRLAKQIDYYTADDVVRDLRAENEYKPVNAHIHLHKFEKIDTPRSTFYGVAKVVDLVALHEACGKALYERNIRYYLGSTKSDVNKSIKATLHDSPAEFFYLNNGVTAVCDHVSPRSTKLGVKKLDVLGLSIINGAQTVASAAEFVRQHPGHNIDDAKVMFTLITASSAGDFGRRVTKARNHQNPVQIANFASLDENQDRLRQEIAQLDYTYHYRPEDLPRASTLITSKAITLDEALRALALRHNDPRYPVLLKSESARLADPESTDYKLLFTPTLSGMTLVNSVVCYRVARVMILENEQKASGQERLIYRNGGHAIAAVMLKRLRNLIEGSAVLDAAAVKARISLPLDQTRQEAFDLARQRLILVGPLAFFRNQGNVISFAADLMEKSYSLTADPAVLALRSVTGPPAEYPRRRLMDYLASHAPQL